LKSYNWRSGETQRRRFNSRRETKKSR